MEPFVLVCPCGVATQDAVFLTQHIATQHASQVVAIFFIPKHAVEELVRGVLEAANG